MGTVGRDDAQQEPNDEDDLDRLPPLDGDATDALPDSAGPTLSLITCYPFHYLGSAPQRFIVTARAETASQ